MLTMTAKGKVTKYPEVKISQRGVSYVKFMIEIPAGEGKWPKRVYLTGFGQLVQDIQSRVQSGCEIEIQAEPSARGYTDKMGKVTAALEGIVRSFKVLSTPAQVAVQRQESTLTDEDIPF